MRIPLSWLKDYIDLSLPPEDIAKILTMAGLEVDDWETIGENLRGIVVGRIIESGKHPNGDKLSLAMVTDGKETYQIVCGAPNCRTGLKTALARIGVSLKQGDQVFTIKKAKIRGVESSGMLCSSSELGLGTDHDGIIELPDNVQEGSEIVDIFGDTYFNISLTPNLGHCTSVFGVARELSAFIEKPLRLPQIIVKENESPIETAFQVEIKNKEACPRYACRVIKNVRVGTSPSWLKERLEKCGIRSVNNVVDVTNYVLLEMGHPLHAFDYDRLEGGKIIVRKTEEGESIRTLDGKERLLKESMLVICDQKKPVAIAGVMGGSESEVHEQTRHIVLESAYFDPSTIRRMSKQLSLQTDASKRFERGTDPNQILMVLDRAAMLIQEVAGGEVQVGVIDIETREFPEMVVSCRLARINQLLGVSLSRGEVEDVFKRLEFHTHWDGHDQFIVHVPTYRNDIKGEIDLIEEVARLYGYDNIPRQGAGYQASNMPHTPIFLFERDIRSILIGQGLKEFLTCDLIGPTLLQILEGFSISSESFVKVLNPTSIEQSVLRTSLLPGLLQVVKYNVDHQNHQIAGFEVGRIHFREGEQFKEQPVVGIILTGQTQLNWDQNSRDYDFFDLKGIVENLLNELGIFNARFENIGLKTFHAGRQASIFVDSLEIGSIGEIHPAVQHRLDVPQRLIFGEFSLQDLLKLSKPIDKVLSLAIYPGSERDWTFTVDKKIPLATIIDVIHKQNCSVLEEVTLKYIYTSEKLPPGFQNMTLHFVYRDPSKTIEQEVVEVEHQRLTDAVLKALQK